MPQEGPSYRRSLLFCFVSLIAGTSGSAVAADPIGERAPESLQRRAAALGLADHPVWLRLGHYRRGPLGYESEADGEAFFLHPDGATSPAKELAASLSGFFAPPPPPPPPPPAQTTSGEAPTDPPAASTHALCRFPARLGWLISVLGIDPAGLPKLDCPRQRDWWERVGGTRGVSLVFASYYLDSPGSAYGHTFLRLRQAPEDAAGLQGADLLDDGVDFAARVDTDNALAYAFKGLFGFFDGSFKRLPYYYKIREYSDIEARDLWEYPLDLSPGQIALLLAHLWELGQTHFDYYFITENCSYHINAALEVVYPEANLVAAAGGWSVLPADALRAVRDAGAIKDPPTFRPSLLRLYRTRLQGLQPAGVEAVGRLFENPEASLEHLPDPRQRARTLEAAADLLDLRHPTEIVTARESEPSRRKQRILERRAALGGASPPLEIKVPMQEAPHLAHDTARFGMGVGATATGEPSLSLDIRGSLHDLADPSLGYPELAHVEFAHARVRLTPGGERISLDSLSLVRVRSLNSLELGDRRASWEVDVGAKTIDDEGCPRCVAGRASLGGGGAVGAFGGALTIWALSAVELAATPGLDGVRGAPLRLGLGGDGGLRLRWSPTLLTVVEGRLRWLPDQTPGHEWDAVARLRWGVGGGWALGLEGDATRHRRTGQAMVFRYF